MYRFAENQIEEYKSQHVISLAMGDIGLTPCFGLSVDVDLSTLKNSTYAWITSAKKGSRRLVITSDRASAVPDRAISIEGSVALEVLFVGHRHHPKAMPNPTYELHPV